MGEYEPNDSRNVTGANAGERQQQQMNQSSDSGMRSPGGAEQQDCGQRWNEGSSGQQSQFDQQQGQMGGGERRGEQMGYGNSSEGSSGIREHMEVIGADGVHIGTVDGVEGDRIKLTKKDSGAGFEGGTHSGHHHYLSTGLVAGIEGDKVRLSANGDVAWGMLEEE